MLSDLRLAWRRLRHAPGFALTAIVTLALAVGANTAIFSVADAVLFRPLPYRDPDRLFLLRQVDPATGLRSTGVPLSYVEAVQQRHSGAAAVALRSPVVMSTQAGPDGAEYVERFIAAFDYFDVLGVAAYRGRLFGRDDVGGPAAVLTFEAWRQRFGGDESIIGRDVTLGGNTHTVIGILPPRMIFPTPSLFFGEENTGHAQYVTVEAPSPAGRGRGLVTSGDAVVRLKPGITAQSAQAELDALVAGMAAPSPQTAVPIIVLDDLRSVLFPAGRSVLVLLLASAGLVLLIGCANLANMLYVRTRHRERELAVHAALGAGRLQVMRALVLEAVMIGAAAGALALLVTTLTFDAVLQEVPRSAYGRAFPVVDLRVGALALLLGTIGGALFAVVPAWRASRSDVATLIKSGGHRPHRSKFRVGRPMVAAQAALAVILIAGSIATGRQLLSVLNEPLGFDPESLLALRVAPDLELPALRSFFDETVAAFERRGDVISAGAGASRPFDRFRANETAVIAVAKVPVVHVLPGYLETLGVRVTAGRLPTQEDAAIDLEPAVMTLSASRLQVPNDRAAGHTLTLQDGRAVRVIGVIEDVTRNADAKGPTVFIVPRTLRSGTFVVRTRVRNQALFAELRREIAARVAPTDPVRAAWVSDTVAGTSRYRNPRFQTLVSGAFAILGLGLAALGIFAVVATAVATRRRELGVRVALGAAPGILVRLMLVDAVVPLGLGIAIGAVAAQGLTRVVQASIAEIEPATLGVIAVAACLMVVAGMIAAYLPARRVSRIDPIVVLRAE